MAAVSNADIAQQLGRVQASLEHLIKDAENARADRGGLYAKLDEHYERITKAEDAAAEAARAAAAAASRIETLQKHMVESIEPPIQEFRNLKLKAAGVVIVLLFIGSVAATVLSVISTDIRRWLGLSP